MKIELRIILDDLTGRMEVFAPMETPDQRKVSATILANAIGIVLNFVPKKIQLAAATDLPLPPNGKVN